MRTSCAASMPTPGAEPTVCVVMWSLRTAVNHIVTRRGQHSRGLAATRTLSITYVSLASIGLGLSAWFERWFPDAFALALAACAIVFAASLAAGASPVESAQWFGAGFWDLVAFTMQIALIIIT